MAWRVLGRYGMQRRRVLRLLVDVASLKTKNVCNCVEVINLAWAGWHICDKHGGDLDLMFAAYCVR